MKKTLSGSAEDEELRLEQLIEQMRTEEGKDKAKIWAILKGISTNSQYALFAANFYHSIGQTTFAEQIASAHGIDKRRITSLEQGESTNFYNLAKDFEKAGKHPEAALFYERAFMLNHAARCAINSGDGRQADVYLKLEKMFLPLVVNIPEPSKSC